MPMMKRAAKSSCHVLANPDPIGVAVRHKAVTKISPRRPSQWFIGSTMNAPLIGLSVYKSRATINNADLHETRGQEDDRVDDADKPILVRDTELFRERQVGTVRASLIPSLCCSSNGAESNRVPQHLGTMPFVVTLVDQCSALVSSELFDFFKVLLVAGNQGSSGEKLRMLRHAVLFGKGAAISSTLGRREVLSEGQALADF
jgi:hypothetical protein